jgi:hypothetical protein
MATGSETDALIELLVQLKVSANSGHELYCTERKWQRIVGTVPDQAKVLLTSQPALAYSLIQLMVKMNILSPEVLQASLYHSVRNYRIDSPVENSVIRREFSFTTFTTCASHSPTRPFTVSCTTRNAKWTLSVYAWVPALPTTTTTTIQRPATAASSPFRPGLCQCTSSSRTITTQCAGHACRYSGGPKSKPYKTLCLPLRLSLPVLLRT